MFCSYCQCRNIGTRPQTGHTAYAVVLFLGVVLTICTAGIAFPVPLVVLLIWIIAAVMDDTKPLRCTACGTVLVRIAAHKMEAPAPPPAAKDSNAERRRRFKG